MRNKIIKFIVTGFYVGLIPIMPGTFGSLLAFPLCYYLMLLSSGLGLKLTIAGIMPIHQ
jgi:phosphatidylglycerophosphatase A